jgi:hypothetical protein
VYFNSFIFTSYRTTLPSSDAPDDAPCGVAVEVDAGAVCWADEASVDDKMNDKQRTASAKVDLTVEVPSGGDYRRSLPIIKCGIADTIILTSNEQGSFYCRSAGAALRPSATRKDSSGTLTHPSGFAFARLRVGYLRVAPLALRILANRSFTP